MITAREHHPVSPARAPSLPGSPSVPSPCQALIPSSNVHLVEHQNFDLGKKVLQIAPNAGRLPVDLRKDDPGGLHGRGRSNASLISLAKRPRYRFKLCFQHRSNSKNLAEEKVRQISRAAHRRFSCAAGVGKRALITSSARPALRYPRRVRHLEGPRAAWHAHLPHRQVHALW